MNVQSQVVILLGEISPVGDVLFLGGALQVGLRLISLGHRTSNLRLWIIVGSLLILPDIFLFFDLLAIKFKIPGLKTKHRLFVCVLHSLNTRRSETICLLYIHDIHLIHILGGLAVELKVARFEDSTRRPNRWLVRSLILMIASACHLDLIISCPLRIVPSKISGHIPNIPNLFLNLLQLSWFRGLPRLHLLIGGGRVPVFCLA